MVFNPFEMLGVSNAADPAEIKRAFRNLAKKHHPDITGGSADKFKRILLAYEQLSDRKGLASIPSAEAYDYQIKVEIVREEHKIQDIFDDLCDSFLTFFDVDKPEYLNLYLRLTPADSKRGGRIRLDLPLVRKCRKCLGSGRPLFIKCKNCGGTGEEKYDRVEIIEFPQGVADGDRIKLRVDNLHLNVIYNINEAG